MQRIKLLFLTIIFSTLFACGGGDSGFGDNGDEGDGGGGGGGSGSGATVDMGNGTGGAFVADVIDLGGITILSAGGTLTATVNIVDAADANAPYTTSVDVAFESACTLAGSASMDSPKPTTNGAASSTYLAEGCVGTDTITASATIDGTTYTAQASMTVEPATVGSIRFESASQEVIAIQGTGGSGLSETSEIIFTVLDETDNPVPGQSVDFVLSTTLGGITLNPSSAISNADGLVKTVVKSGTVNTSVRVTATVTSTAISTQSVALAVSTGIPDNNSFEIAAEVLNPSVWECNGGVVPITAFVADHFNNPAPNGTAVAFQTEGGIIGPSCFTTDGQCSVDWVSNIPRPFDARVTILATVIGEEGFDDIEPSNGRFDIGEPYVDLPEAWLDINENDVRDGNEPFLDFNSDSLYNIADGSYDGVLCTQGAIGAGHCSDLLHARSSLTLVMASVNQDYVLYKAGVPISSISLPDDQSVQTFRVDVQDARGQRPPAGTTISVATTNGTIVGGDSTDVLSSSSPGPSSLSFSMKADNTPSEGVLTISVAVPGSHCQGAVKTDFGGIIVDDSLDVTPPTVTGTKPTNNAQNVAVDIPAIEITFSEPMNGTTVSVTVTSGGFVPSSIGIYDSGTNTYFWNRNVGEFDADTLYTVTVAAAAEDTARNLLAGGEYKFTFRTAPPP